MQLFYSRGARVRTSRSDRIATTVNMHLATNSSQQNPFENNLKEKKQSHTIIEMCAPMKCNFGNLLQNLQCKTFFIADFFPSSAE